MAVRDIAIACQGGGSHAAYAAGVLPVLLGELDNLRVAREAPPSARAAHAPRAASSRAAASGARIPEVHASSRRQDVGEPGAQHRAGAGRVRGGARR